MRPVQRYLLSFQSRAGRSSCTWTAAQIPAVGNPAPLLHWLLAFCSKANKAVFVAAGLPKAVNNQRDYI